MRYLILLTVSFLTLNCSFKEEKKTKENNTDNEFENYHKDGDYKYEYRTGNSGKYNYNYDVVGYDSYGNYVYGNIDVYDGDGDGYIYDEDGNEIFIYVEWVEYGVLEAYDEFGEYYELEVE